MSATVCENVLLQPSTCLALAGGKEISAKSKRNLQYIASMIYLILTKLHDDLPPPNGQAMDINTSNNTSRAKGPEDLKKRIGASGKSVVASSTEGQNNPDVFTVTFIDVYETTNVSMVPTTLQLNALAILLTGFSELLSSSKL